MRLRRPSLPTVDPRVFRDARLLVAVVPLAALVLLITSSRGARTEPIVANATTTTAVPSGEAGKYGAPPVEDDGSGDGGVAVIASGAGAGSDDYSDGAGVGGSSGSGYSGGGSSGSRSGTARRNSASTGTGGSSGSSARVEAATEERAADPGTPTTAASVIATTTTTIAVPQAVVNEAGSPAVLVLVGVGVAALAVNGLILARKRRASKDPT